MASRREIREASVQFLYCADIEESTDKEVLYKTFWSIVLESDEKKLRKASAKALVHLNQGRSSRYSKLVERAPEAKAIIKVEEATKLSDALTKILDRENSWQAQCDTVNRLLNTLRKEWVNLLQDYPKLTAKLEPFSAQITTLDRIGQRIHMVEEPENYPEQTDISHLRDTVKKIAEYRASVDEFVTGVLNEKKSIDEHIGKVVDNFQPERIDPVDRAAIRLATYEILYKDEVPAPVAINEAIEIVKKFGSNESARFTNGILDAIAKNIEKN